MVLPCVFFFSAEYILQKKRKRMAKPYVSFKEPYLDYSRTKLRSVFLEPKPQEQHRQPEQPVSEGAKP